MRKTIWIFVTIVIVGGFIYYFLSKNYDSSVVKIGAVLPLTGDVASYGKDSKSGIDLAVEQANKNQNKYKFEFEYEDGVLSNNEYYRLKVKCPYLKELRLKYGLSSEPKFGYHLTIGRIS